MPTDFTESIRITEVLLSRIASIQKQVKAKGGRMPTKTAVIEMAFSYTEESVLVEALVDAWREPGEPERQESLRKAKAKLKRSK